MSARFGIRSVIGSGRIARRLVLYLVLFSSAITLIITTFQLYRDYRRDLDLISTQLAMIEQVHLDSLANALWATAADELQLQLKGILHLPDMAYLAVIEAGKPATCTAASGARSARCAPKPV